MAASMISSATVATVNRASSAQATMVAPFTGLKSNAALPVTKKRNKDITTLASNGGKAHCMRVWPTKGLQKFETFSYLPELTDSQLTKEIEYLIRNKWIPCLEFTLQDAYVHRKYLNLPGYYDGRYWTMWKLPMFGCTDPGQVLLEIKELTKVYPKAHARMIGFDNRRQVQCISFNVYKPKGNENV